MQIPPPDNATNATLGPDVGVLVYDARSYVLLWNGSAFAEYQDLETDQRYDPSTDGAPFTGMAFSLNRSNTSSPARLRGATDFTPFSAGGEVYIAISQSVCDRKGSHQCKFDQPRSAVLQWDRVALAFTELLAMTDKVASLFPVHARARAHTHA